MRTVGKRGARRGSQREQAISEQIAARAIEAVIERVEHFIALKKRFGARKQVR